MKKILLLLTGIVLSGCGKPLSYPQQRRGITHDYVISTALEMCKPHGGLHYIIDITKIKDRVEEGNNISYPCDEVHRFKCQDDYLIEFDSGVTWCDIREIQVDESTKKKYNELKTF